MAEALLNVNLNQKEKLFTLTVNDKSKMECLRKHLCLIVFCRRLFFYVSFINISEIRELFVLSWLDESSYHKVTLNKIQFQPKFSINCLVTLINKLLDSQQR